ncbi:glycoside hydrolase family 18 protein [Lasallia pustulata]|uniref:Glycoside hydrolase family 18 protein n=1 Tax=Lasallia pustulata TaxID=136370 RepID=A0A1W5DAS1_9LECA|nr:glycoside hydrolase family 18 protein [Lasallia pustulata]
MHSLLSAFCVLSIAVPGALGQVDSDPLDSAVDTGVYHIPTATPTDFSGDDGALPYYITATAAGSSGTAGVQNKVGTFLYGYNGCNKLNSAYKGNIDEAYYDSWTIANTAGVLSNINWNEAAALEYSGAPGLNQPQQSQIQAVLANIATVIYSYKNLFLHPLHVRCDDPFKRCQNRPDQDPCQPNPPNPGEKPKPTPLAYARNTDPDDQYPMINFCNGFFQRRSLTNAISYGTALRSPENLRLSNYDNRAQTLFHELTHLDLAADSPDPNPRSLTDLLSTKILARYHENTGLYTQQNADNLAYFALAKYVMTKNNNVYLSVKYPHLPIVTNEIDGPPWPALLDTIAEFITDGNIVYLNVSAADLDDLALNDYSEAEDDIPGCPDNENQSGPSGGTVLTIDALAPDSAYPTDYLSSVSSWISSLGVTTTVPASAQPTLGSSASPTPTPTDADSCDVSYKFIYDEFQIRGKNFVPANFGTDGSGLKHQIAGCDAITDWTFQLTPTDPTYQWYASGTCPSVQRLVWAGPSSLLVVRTTEIVMELGKGQVREGACFRLKIW